MVILSRLWISIFLLTAFSAQAAPGEMTRNLKKYSKKIKTLKQEISLLKRQLGDTNKRYLTVMKRRKHIDEILYNQKTNLKKNLTEIEESQTKFKDVLRSLILQTIDGSPQKPGEIVYQKILLKSLQHELTELRKNKRTNRELSKEIAELNQKYKEYIDIEQGILNLMEDWEYSKKEKAMRYRSHIRMVKTIKQNRSSRRKYSRKKTPLKTNARFRNPITKYIDLKHGYKGITYKFKGHQKVLNTYPGKVVYSGKLSTYGNVLMVDHGRDLRSIILGQFTPKYKKGVLIKKGDVIGYTNTAKNRLGKIYFEVRKKNKAQNTINLIDKSSLTKTEIHTKTNTQT